MEVNVGEEIDQEFEAAKTVLDALEPLSPEVRVSVLNHVAGRLQIDLAKCISRGGDLSAQMAPSPHVEALMRRYGIIRFTF
jgi:hypothetical protein